MSIVRELYEKTVKSRIPWILFYVGLTIELLIVLVDKSQMPVPYESHLFRLTFLLFATKLIFSKRSKKEWAALLLLEILAFVSYRVTGRNDVIRMVTFVAACKNIPLKKVMKYVFWVTATGCLVIVLLALTGIYGDVSLLTVYGRDLDVYAYYGGTQSPEEVLRYTLGMGHPNAVSCMFLMVIAAGVYAYFDKLSWYSYLFMEALNLGLFYLTDSKTAMLLTTLLLAAACLMRYVGWLRTHSFAYIVTALTLLFCLLISVDFAMHAVDVQQAKYDRYYYGARITDPHTKLLVWVDEHTSGRISTLAGTEHDEGTISTWSLFSQERNMNYYFDTGWVKLFYRYGIVWGLLYAASGFLLAYRLYKHKDAAGMVMLAVFALYTIVEAHLISPYIGRNYLFLFMGCYFGNCQTQRH